MEYSWEIDSIDNVSNTMTVKYVFNTSHQADPILVNISKCPAGVNINDHVKRHAPTTLLVSGGTYNSSVVPGQRGIDSVYVDSVTAPADITLEDYKKLKLEEIAAKRYEFETSGFNLGGTAVNTSRESQAILTSAYISLKNNLITSVDWKDSSGTFVTLGLPEIEMLSTAVSTHVQSAFSKEKLLTEQVALALNKTDVDLVKW
jgi:hypothetical protein